MSDIRAWLSDLDLAQYADAFEENDIDERALPELSDQDLRDIGIGSLGHRRVLLGAIKKRTAEESESTEPVPVTPPPIAAAPRSEAERRQITVMFCDLVGSTALSERLDPEDMRAVISAYRRAAGEVAERYQGHVAQYLGDGLMVYFGWPVAHEDDAIRAVHAGLGIIATIDALEAPAPLSVRVGVATGLVVVGADADEPNSEAQLAIGETPNIAARVQGLAPENAVAIATNTRRLLGGVFDLEDMGKHAVKGVTGGLQVHRVLGERISESRFAASGGPMTPFVGREAEVTLLLERWDQARHGEGQVALICGEPGIGKSRVTEVLNERLLDEPHVRLRYQCSPYHTSSALHPVIGQLERAAGFSREDDAEARLDKLEALLAKGGAHQQAMVLLAILLSLPTERYPPLELSPQKQKELTLDALGEQVLGLAADQPVLMILEDAHWIDPTTLETVTSIIERIERAPVLVLVTYRPEFDPPWTRRDNVTVITLKRLPRMQGQAMVERVSGGKAMPEEVVAEIVAKTDGVPLFVEELTMTVLEAGFLEDAGDHWVLDGPLPPLAIPATLQDSLMARLDRLSPVKEVAQIGACIGREFSHELLAAVAPMGDNALDEALQQLVTSEIILRRGGGSDMHFVFKHALVQDSAYESLLKSKRFLLHKQIGEALSRQFPDITVNQPELLAHHYTSANLIEKAVPCWTAAGQKSLTEFALPEAISHLREALRLNDTLPTSMDRDRQELGIRVALGTSYFAMLGWAAPEVPKALRPTRELCHRLGETEKLIFALYYIWLFHATRSEYPEAYGITNELFALAKSQDSADVQIIAHNTACVTGGMTGDFSHAHEHYEAVLTHYDFDRHKKWAPVLNGDPKCNVLSWAAVFLWALGYPDQARRASMEVIDLAREVGDPFNLIWSLTAGCLSYLLGGKPDTCFPWIDEARTVGREQGLSFAEAVLCAFTEGAALIATGRVSEGYPLLVSGTTTWRDVGGTTNVPYGMIMMAQALAALDRLNEASVKIREAINVIESTGHRTHEAEAHRVKGEVLRLGPAGNNGAAEECFLRAIEIARGQRAKSWELRAATSLAKLWHSQRKSQEAQKLLAPVYDWFTEGFDTADLIEAKALLDELK
jgi:class 3 adenylate cyclase/predicted ATPase